MHVCAKKGSFGNLPFPLRKKRNIQGTEINNVDRYLIGQMWNVCVLGLSYTCTCLILFPLSLSFSASFRKLLPFIVILIRDWLFRANGIFLFIFIWKIEKIWTFRYVCSTKWTHGRKNEKEKEIVWEGCPKFNISKQED
jgi:hypothetical protein